MLMHVYRLTVEFPSINYDVKSAIIEGDGVEQTDMVILLDTGSPALHFMEHSEIFHRINQHAKILRNIYSTRGARLRGILVVSDGSLGTF